ncbi:MAG: hypothetical protein MK135_11300 [Polyangiaceae bacterium]|nr:hypothetical protein [Polyangiaceae bacterium]
MASPLVEFPPPAAPPLRPRSASSWLARVAFARLTLKSGELGQAQRRAQRAMLPLVISACFGLLLLKAISFDTFMLEFCLRVVGYSMWFTALFVATALFKRANAAPRQRYVSLRGLQPASFGNRLLSYGFSLLWPLFLGALPLAIALLLTATNSREGALFFAQTFGYLAAFALALSATVTAVESLVPRSHRIANFLALSLWLLPWALSDIALLRFSLPDLFLQGYDYLWKVAGTIS